MVGCLTLIGLAIRLAGLDQSLFGDELYTYAIVTDHSLGETMSAVHDMSITPPLHYVLAWGGAQIAEPYVGVRLPSIVFGTATIPAVYLLGRQVRGPSTGLMAAALIALSPFAVFYSAEGRAYATMVFLVAVSTLALLRALEERGRAWWGVHALATVGVLYLHYSAIFVLAAQALWAAWVHRRQWRSLVVVNGAIALAYLPWIPSWRDQRENPYVEAVGNLYPLDTQSFFEYPARLLVGHPFMGLDAVPGRFAIVALAVVLAAAIAAAVARGIRGGPSSLRAVSPPVVLVALLAIATPLGLLAYNALESSLYAPRNLSASMPAFAVLGGLIVTSLPRRLAVAAATAVIAAFGVAAVEGLDGDRQRPPFNEVADWVNDSGLPRAPVVAPDVAALEIYLDRGHRVLRPQIEDQPAWRRSGGGASLFLVRQGKQAGLPLLAGPDGRAVLKDGREFQGLIDLRVGRYSGQLEASLGERAGRPEISRSVGPDLAVRPDSGRGFVDGLTVSAGSATVGGWATDSRKRAPVTQILVFTRGRLVAASTAPSIRTDIADAYGPQALVSGFHIELPQEEIDLRTLRVFAVNGLDAAELKLTRAVASRARSSG